MFRTMTGTAAVAVALMLVRLEHVRYDVDGRLQKTVIGGESGEQASRPGPPGPGGGLRKRIIAKKTEAFKDMLGELAALAESYAHLPADRMKAFAAGAVITPASGPRDGSVGIDGRNVLMAADAMTVWVDATGFAVRRVEISSVFEGQPVSIAADYRSLENGLTYQVRSTLRYPHKTIDIVVETFDYILTAGSR